MTIATPYELTPDEIRVRIQAEVRNPNVREVYSTTLKNGPRTFRFATVFEIVDGVGAHHHFCLRLDTYIRTKSVGWSQKPEKSVTIDSQDPSEIAILMNFLRPVIARDLPSTTGEYHVLDGQKFKNIKDLMGVVRGTDSKRRFKILRAIAGTLDAETVTASDWSRIFETGGSALLQSVAAAARMVEYRREFEKLSALIDDGETREGDLQRLLAANPWMFGSEYSELIPRRTWTRDDRLDYMLRRTVDQYLEIIEIKTPFRKSLFRYDSSHDSYAPSAELSTVIGQVVRYIEEVDRNRDSIIAQDGADPLKVRARVVIGLDGTQEEQQALRNLNGHLHRIELITFDQLRSIAARVLDVFVIAVAGQKGTPTSDNLPF